ncbi:P-loop NTPase fold protein [Paenibacillus sp. 37]|uniref:P-loop NTPase fold protein n=1 Tax=Paenibacillus sp. 37 TaxID=2607911 RepID=UPI00122E0A2B|nr:P-loop NTPase fold protein [Paenibacillus sp. 37]
MKADSTSNVIENYLQSREINYALMIDQVWGAGKTYYWNNMIVPYLNKEGMIPCYITLNGVKTQEEFSSRMALGFRQAVFLKSEPNPLEIEQYLDTEKLCLCIDDLERAEMEISNIFGHVNLYVEHKQIKTIFLCNEEKVKKTDLERYLDYKEKIIGKTIRLEQNLSYAIKQMIDELYKNSRNSDYHVFLIKVTDVIEELLIITEKNKRNKMRKAINLRILKRALIDFHKVYNTFDETIHNTVKIQSLLFTLMLSIEMQYKDISHALSVVETYNERVFYQANYNENIEGSFHGMFGKYHKHSMFRELIYYYPSISRYLRTGSLDEKEFKENFSQSNDEKETDPEKILWGPYWELEDEVFLNAIGTVMKKVEAGQYELYEFGNIYAHIGNFKDKNLLPRIYYENPDLLSRFKASIDYKFKTLSEDFNFKNVQSKLNSRVNEINNYVNDKIKGKKIEQNAILAKDLITYLETSPEKFVNKINDLNKTAYDVPIFKYIEEDRFIEGLKKLNNSALDKVRAAIYYRYQNYSTNQIIIGDIDPLKEIVKKLKSYISSKNNVESVDCPIPLSSHLLQNLCDTLDEIIQKT